MIGPKVSRRSGLRNVSRMVIVGLLLSVLLSGGLLATSAEASCEENFDECEGSLDPLTDSLSALNVLAWAVLRLGGLIVLMGGLILFVSSKTGMGTKMQAQGAIIAGLFMLTLYFAQDALFGVIDFIVSG